MSTQAIQAAAQHLIHAAHGPETADVPRCNTLDAQKRLNTFYLRELAPPSAYDTIPQPSEYDEIVALESEWNLHEESRLDLSGLPENAEQLEEWYYTLRRTNREAVAPFFRFLAEEASLEQLAFYVCLEAQVDGRFDDTIALSQIGMLGDMKLAVAENFWDEMGLGELEGMHTLLFGKAEPHFRQYLQRFDPSILSSALALKNGNLLSMYALRRWYVVRLLGTLTLLEDTVPYRFSKMVKGMRRHQVPEEVIAYHVLHTKIDVVHGNSLVKRVLLPLATQNPAAIRDICIGCLIRFNVEKDYYEGAGQVMENMRQSLQ
ncbi:spermidine/putrescine ABC transporter [Burkholderia lata]|uniref:iron-containing redox enzyme family protein n=1 Tax=Burkholderia lata (strain ATCC 17760 / DSM 23089 / LMG 22485 / NCIMB 9086 / R18194 / 383) TaxID=482957 RepID=UPI0014539DB3|nr:iron-containing redox enzyme family protein [Burkholderia lata]VWB49282.1 spermidine/putrescine ABC transporter [Burkholderia lata]